MSAKRVLILLTAINYLNYIDRYILSAVLSSIQKDLSLSDFEAGLLATGFMVPYMLTSPLFGWWGDTKKKTPVLFFGATLWSLATFFTGFMKNFTQLMSMRFGLGLGESAFTTTSVPLLSDVTEPDKRGKVIAIFSSAIPVGSAIGYVLGGVIGHNFGWRACFYIVGVPGIVLALFLLGVKEPVRDPHAKKFNWPLAIQALKKSKRYLLAVLGYCAYTFVVGGIAHWVPSYIQRTYALNQLQANSMFGGIAVVCGLAGTLVGGWLGDRMSRKNNLISGHLKMSSISMLVAFPLFALLLWTQNLVAFCILLALCEFFFFLSTSPINVALLDAVPAKFQNTAMALAIFSIHVLGDAVSSPLMGKISDLTGSLAIGLSICVPVIALSSAFWWIASKAPGYTGEKPA